MGNIKKFLPSDEVLLLVGARQAGKTTILHALQDELTAQGEKTFFLNLEDPDYQRILNQSPKSLFQIFPIDPKTKTTILIDEIQYLENPTNFLKYFYDTHREKIKLIVSGSSAFYMDKKFKDSLVGRKIIFPIRTLSFREFLRFKNEDGLLKLLPNEFSPSNYLNSKNISLIEKENIINQYNEYLLFGGYPRVVLAPFPDKLTLLQDIAYSYIKKDIHDANIKQDEVFYRLFKVIAAQISNLVNTNELSKTLGVSNRSIGNYLYVMQKSFHILLIRPFYKNIRKELTKMPKIYFYDLGLRNFLTNNFDSVLTRPDRGALLENAVVRQLAERTGSMIEERVKFWRSRAEAEVDFVFDEKIGFEVKYNAALLKQSKYRMFLQQYPMINLNVVSLIRPKKENFPVWEPWLL